MGGWTQWINRVTAVCPQRYVYQQGTAGEAKLSEAGVQVFPNPTVHSFTIWAQEVPESNGVVWVYDMKGVLREQAVIPKGVRSVKVGEKLLPGTYILKYQYNGALYTQKLLKL